MLFQMNGTDPIVFAGAAAALGLVALGAGFAPARRAAGVDPMQALRQD
jgi:ABC-type lipoprotein release transport system permease subunit